MSLQARIGIGSLLNNCGKVLLSEVERFKPDIVWVDGGFLISNKVINKLRKKNILSVHYTPDSIFAPGMSNLCFRKAIGCYDHLITTKTQDLDYYVQNHARNLIYSYQGFDPKIHRKVELSDHQRRHFECDIAFIGHCMKNRMNYLNHIKSNLDVRMKIYGTGWDSSSVPKALRRNFMGPALDQDYAKAIAGAKICLGFLNNEVKDDFTTRTFEIPAAGGFFLAERTKEHLKIFEEDTEAVFFDNKQELLSKVNYFLKEDVKRKEISELGHKKIIEGPYTWDKIIKDITFFLNKKFL